jgi:signal-transduction protein with cAMP-binding, CBS, and nucleotidyltransferase domain
MVDQLLAEPTTELRDLRLWPAIRVPNDTTIRGVARVMRQADSSTVLVGDDGASLVTERDLVDALAQGRDPEGPIGDVAQRNPFWAPAGLQLAEAAALMVRFGVRHLIVRYPDGSAGVLSMRDAFGVLVRHIDPVRWLERFRQSLHL